MTIEHIDVVIVGPGISGVSAAWHVQNRCPTKSYAIVEARAAMGGTRDLFRYPGVRSDSDMYTLGFRFRPWTGKKSIADGASILSYLQETAAESGIDGHIRYGHRMVAADWSTATSRWILHVDHAGTEETITCSFLVCSGFYDYAKASRCGIVSSRSGATTFRPPRRLPRRRSTGPGCSAGPTWSISRESTGASALLTRVASTRPAPTEPRRLPPGSAPEEYLSRHGVWRASDFSRCRWATSTLHSGGWSR